MKANLGESQNEWNRRRGRKVLLAEREREKKCMGEVRNLQVRKGRNC